MKRKRCPPNDTLFIWNDRSKRSMENKVSHECNQKRPQLDVILKPTTIYSDCYPLPYELLVKIFNEVIESSEDVINDIYSICMVCDGWRGIVLNSPSLWRRLDLSGIPITDGNLKIFRKIYDKLPNNYNNVKSLAISGSISLKQSTSISFIEKILKNDSLEKLMVDDLHTENRMLPSTITRSLIDSNLKHLTITSSVTMFNNQKWLCDHLISRGRDLETLNLAMSLTSISNQLIRSVWSDHCPKLKYLDLSTCDALTTHSFDALQLSQNLPSLEVLRLGNVSFKRVHEIPTKLYLTQLRELSIPIGMRDSERDDVLFATLAFGSSEIKTLDLRGSTISTFALLETPSNDVRELHMDDLHPISRKQYHKVIEKWAHSLEILSLVKINCSDTLDSCLEALINQNGELKLRELDLNSSDVTGPTLVKFLKKAKSLDTINLSSCRSLPRGCKAVYSRNLQMKTAFKLRDLLKKLV